jgi:hypothetical protein
MVDWKEPPADEQRATTDRSTEGGALDATGAYETAGSVVLYDTEQPLAWIQSDSAVSLDEMN